MRDCREVLTIWRKKKPLNRVKIFEKGQKPYPFRAVYWGEGIGLWTLGFTHEHVALVREGRRGEIIFFLIKRLGRKNVSTLMRCFAYGLALAKKNDMPESEFVSRFLKAGGFDFETWKKVNTLSEV